MSDGVRIVLFGAAKAAHDQMLAEALLDNRLSISSSKLMNWIAVDYFENFFKKRKRRLCKEHLNERKCFQEAMKIEDPGERRRALQDTLKALGAPTMQPRRKRQKPFQEGNEPEMK